MIKKDEIALEVATPAGTYFGKFPASAKVSIVIDAIVRAEKLDAGKKYELFMGEERIAPDRALSSFNLGDHALLRLVPARGHDEIILHVATPAGAFQGIFPNATTVKQVIAEIVRSKKLDAGDRLELFHDDRPLDPQHTLASYHLGDEARLTLLATGSGV